VRLTDREQRYVRTALRFLRHRVGGWQRLADAIGIKDSLVPNDEGIRCGRKLCASCTVVVDGNVLCPLQTRTAR
jgi:hypothetical protein